MKINLIQYVFAYDIPGKLCYVGFPLAVLAFSFFASELSVASLTDVRVWGSILFVVVLSLPFGVLLAALFICIFLSPFYLAVVRMNGGPFKKGDRVYVISGQQKGKTAEVYSECQGLSARIVIGEEEKKNFKDIYSSLSLIKTETAEQNPACNIANRAAHED
ncbi:MAG: hypothetical protein WCS96_03425 [Victivallales bacterium]